MRRIVVDTNGTPHDLTGNMQPEFNILAKMLGLRCLVLASNNGDLYNPLDVNNNIHRRDREHGGLFWKLSACSKECYDSYTAFLRSKNRTQYILAQRRFLQ